MEELKNKLTDAMKSIDFNNLTIYELGLVAEIAEKVDKIAKKDYADMLADMGKEFCFSNSIEKPKSIGELGGK